MGCEHCTLTSADLAANSAEGIYSWTEAAVYEDERCLQAARAAYASFDKKRYQLTILLVTGWWRRKDGLVKAKHPSLVDRIASFTDQMPPVVELAQCPEQRFERALAYDDPLADASQLVEDAAPVASQQGAVSSRIVHSVISGLTHRKYM